MWEKPVALREISKRPAVQRQAWWEKPKIAKTDFSGIGGLDSCETRQDGALAGAGGAEQSEALAGPQTDANVDGEGAPRFDYVRIKHWRCVFAQADESATQRERGQEEYNQQRHHGRHAGVLKINPDLYRHTAWVVSGNDDYAELRKGANPGEAQ